MIAQMEEDSRVLHEKPVNMVPEVRFELTRCRQRRILSPLRLPFRHSGLSGIIHEGVSREASGAVLVDAEHLESAGILGTRCACTPRASCCAKTRRFAEGFRNRVANLGTLLKVFGDALSRDARASHEPAGQRRAVWASTSLPHQNLQQSAEVCRVPSETFRISE